MTTEETILQDIGVIDEGLNEIVEFADGQATTLPAIHAGAKTYTLTAQKFGASQPPATYTVFTGSVFNIIALALLDASEFAAGVPLSLALKVGTTWYGITIAAS